MDIKVGDRFIDEDGIWAEVTFDSTEYDSENEKPYCTATLGGACNQERKVVSCYSYKDLSDLYKIGSYLTRDEVINLQLCELAVKGIYLTKDQVKDIYKGEK